MEFVYQVREKGVTFSRDMSLDEIMGEVNAGKLSRDAIVTSKEIDQWHSVAELLGEVPTPTFPFLCPLCRQALQGRYLDIGRTMLCDECDIEVPVPNINSALSVKAVRADIESLKRDAKYGRVGIGGGIAATIGCYFLAVKEGWRHYAIAWVPIVMGLGYVHRYWSKAKALEVKLKTLQQVDTERLGASASRDVKTWLAILIGLVVFWVLTHLD